MITKPIVFVLGAGASQPYGFPLGVTLVDQISEQIIKKEPIVRRLERLQFGSTMITEFAQALRAARPYSIDAFLEMRKPFHRLGKAAIADVLLRAEDQGRLETTSSDVDWYRYLFNRVLVLKNPDYYSRQAALITVVTFNFDRSLERALFLSLSANFGVTDDVAVALAKGLRIIHLHGQLGGPKWLSPESNEATPYGCYPDELEPAIEKAANSIRIVDEEVLDSIEVGEAQLALREAQFVYFIGFGFDERNLAKLGTPGTIQRSVTPQTTAFKWTQAEHFPVQRHFGNHTGMAVYDGDAIGFLQQAAVGLYD